MKPSRLMVTCGGQQLVRAILVSTLGMVKVAGFRNFADDGAAAHQQQIVRFERRVGDFSAPVLLSVDTPLGIASLDRRPPVPLLGLFKFSFAAFGGGSRRCGIWACFILAVNIELVP
jgi:hypothetical protein